VFGDIVTSYSSLIIHACGIEDSSNVEIIGKITNFSLEGIDIEYGLNLEFELVKIEKPDTTKKAKINKIIIVTIIIGLSIIIILIILKIIV